jgi:hypothetical protein
MALAMVTGVLVGALAVWAGPAQASGGIDVFVGYADSFHPITATFPTPWTGSPGVTFEGCQPISSCTYDSGAVRVINNTGASVTINSVAVHVDTCTYTGWPSATLSPGDQLIVTQLVSGASLPTDGCTGPTPTHMDTSDIGPAGSPYSNNCTRDGIIPSVDVTVNGTTMTYIDTGQVLNTGGFDLGECPHDTDEATPWTQINPSTNVLLPSNGATLTGSQYLDASASDTGGVAKVEFHLTGGTLNKALIATATPTFYGWLAGWNTATVAYGTYTLQSVAYDATGNSGQSTAITITVGN